MSRPRKPTRVLKLNGAFERNPKRGKERENEPDLPLGVCACPGYFDASQRECWDELATKGAAWLTLADSPLLESAAKLMASDRRNELDTQAGKRYDKLLADLGFGPIARTKIKVPRRADDDQKALLA